MKRKLTLSLAMLALAFLVATIGYAAFPVANPRQATTTTVSNSTSNNSVQQVSQEAAYNQAPAAPATTEGSHSGGKSQLVALLLCLVIGGLGIHRFYLGYTWQGVVQLLTAGGCGIWALIDLIRIITGDLQPKDGKYSKTL